MQLDKHFTGPHSAALTNWQRNVKKSCSADRKPLIRDQSLFSYFWTWIILDFLVNPRQAHQKLKRTSQAKTTLLLQFKVWNLPSENHGTSKSNRREQAHILTRYTHGWFCEERKWNYQEKMSSTPCGKKIYREDIKEKKRVKRRDGSWHIGVFRGPLSMTFVL